jgi:hypothetical protein
MFNLDDLEPKPGEFNDKTNENLFNLMRSLEDSIFISESYGVKDVTLLLRINKELENRGCNMNFLQHA